MIFVGQIPVSVNVGSRRHLEMDVQIKDEDWIEVMWLNIWKHKQQP